MASRPHSYLTFVNRILDRDQNPWRLLLLCVLVGIVAGLGATAFYVMLDGARHLFLDVLAGYRPAGPAGEPPLFHPTAHVFNRWVFFALPTAGGLLSGWLVFRFAPEAEGHGTDAAIHAYHLGAGAVRARVPFVKAVASALTIGSGGSGGREGPIAQIGAGFGSVLAGWLHLRPKERRILMAAGMAGGIGAIFHAPMAGALFAAEVLYKDLDLEYEVIIPSVVSSIVAYSVFASQMGWDALFVTPALRFTDPRQLLLYTVLALVMAGGAVLYVRCFYGVRALFARWRVPNCIKPAVGGLVVGTIGLFLPEALGTGYGIIQRALVDGTPLAADLGGIGAGLLLAVALGKIVTTSFSIASGGSGGVFGPAIVIGGSLGGGVGLLLKALLPGMGLQTGSFVLVGMAAFFAAAANTPLSTIIMVSEMTGNYHLLVPSLWTCTLTYLLVRRHTLYENQVVSRFEAPVHTENMISGVLRSLRVGDLWHATDAAGAPPINPGIDLRRLLRLSAEAEHSSLPVVDSRGRLKGIVHGRDLRAAAGAHAALQRGLVAQDLISPPLAVSRDATILEAVRRMRLNDVEEIVVVDPDTGAPSGMLSMAEILAAYDRQIAACPVTP